MLLSKDSRPNRRRSRRDAIKCKVVTLGNNGCTDDWLACSNSLKRQDVNLSDTGCTNRGQACRYSDRDKAVLLSNGRRPNDRATCSDVIANQHMNDRPVIRDGCRN